MVEGSREIEVKYRIADPVAAAEALSAAGFVLSPPIHQDDQAYAEVGWQYGMSKVGVAFARLRTVQGRYVFTVKKPIDNEMVCTEYECEVSDREQMHHAIMAMGFYPTVQIVKTRRTASRAALSLCLDEVERIGSFLEVERLVASHQSGLQVQAELNEFVRSLGIAAERTTDTYDSLIRAAMQLSA
ncbi:class IV adenylate cyclase [Actinomadura graeca]|uniref:Class IV adenylate cyclase n=1 Tax=Actinomadura graeca TaxID=2750812 RepID=A0ABX8QUZ3_9ACTN|nr:class IV adenylate cyclase [Actinomadura graeca]QXJ22196.1 class IV adenylate cyclase [Actinomadura graeca]